MPFLATGFGAFLMRQAFLQVPRDLQDAASLDGYGHWRFMTRVAVPLARPRSRRLSVFAFLGAWNQYLWPLLVTKDEKYRTVQIGLKQLRATSIQDVNVTFAGVIIAALPLVILLLVFQKQLVRGSDRRRRERLTLSLDALRRPNMKRLLRIAAIGVVSVLVVAACGAVGATTGGGGSGGGEQSADLPARRARRRRRSR